MANAPPSNTEITRYEALTPSIVSHHLKTGEPFVSKIPSSTPPKVRTIAEWEAYMASTFPMAPPSSNHIAMWQSRALDGDSKASKEYYRWLKSLPGGKLQFSDFLESRTRFPNS